jgi:hypothetical protein
MKRKKEREKGRWKTKAKCFWAYSVQYYNERKLKG